MDDNGHLHFTPPSKGVANFVLCPIILLWQILYSFYNYAEMIKREPGFFGTRAWSHYGSFYLRHFNELDHEFVTRLSRGYKGMKLKLRYIWYTQKDAFLVGNFSNLWMSNGFLRNVHQQKSFKSAASRYMAIFLSHSTTVIAKSLGFFCGSILSVLVILTVIDEDVLAGELGYFHEVIVFVW